jgi:hypothetical protein
MGYEGLVSLEEVAKPAARTILGILGLAGFFGLLWFGQFVIEAERKELKEWAWQKAPLQAAAFGLSASTAQSNRR